MLKRQAAPLRVQAVSALREDIIRGEFGPGMRLTEKSLEERLGVSRTVVREALRQLESEQLIRIMPHIGPVVAELTIDDARHLYEVRGALEAVAGRLAAENATPEQLARLNAAFKAIVDGKNAPVAELIELKNAFYDAVIDASGNPIIGEMLANVQARISLLRGVTLSHPGRGSLMVEELTLVVDAINAGDADGAYAASLAHVRSAADIALDHLLEQKEQSATA